MPNGNGAGKLQHGGKDIKVPKYTVNPLEEGDEYDIQCSADEFQDYLKKHNFQRRRQGWQVTPILIQHL